MRCGRGTAGGAPAGGSPRAGSGPSSVCSGTRVRDGGRTGVQVRRCGHEPTSSTEHSIAAAAGPTRGQNAALLVDAVYGFRVRGLTVAPVPGRAADGQDHQEVHRHRAVAGAVQDVAVGVGVLLDQGLEPGPELRGRSGAIRVSTATTSGAAPGRAGCPAAGGGRASTTAAAAAARWSPPAASWIGARGSAAGRSAPHGTGARRTRRPGGTGRPRCRPATSSCLTCRYSLVCGSPSSRASS